MAYTHPLMPRRSPRSDTRLPGIRLPNSFAEWQSRYSWLDDMYNGSDYWVGDEFIYGLFRALDDEGKVMAETRRITRDAQHVVDTDVRAMAGSRLVLDWSGMMRGTMPKSTLDEGMAVWARSRLQDKKARWARSCASMGDVFIEAVRGPGGGPASLVAYDPRCVRVEYDPTGVHITKATIQIDYFDQAPDSGDIMVGEPLLTSYRRVLTPTSIEVRELQGRGRTEGELVESQSGDHGLGVVPLVHIPFLELSFPEHGMWAAHGLEPCLAHIDSHIAQIRAITNRYGNPILTFFGATVDDDEDLFKFGRVLSAMSPDARAQYLEIGGNAITGIWQVVKEYHQSIRDTLPEFLFSGAGANTSGRAMDLWAQQFRIKMDEVRGRFYGAIARATQYAVLMDRDAAWTDEADWFRILAPPVLPIDAGTRVNQVVAVRSAKLITLADAVRQLQAVGMVDDELDADDYARDLEPAGVPAAPAGADPATDAPPESAQAPPGVDKAQDTALNGAQVQAAQSIVESVAAGNLPRETGVDMLVVFFNIDASTADRLMGQVGRGFEPAAPTVPTATPTAPSKGADPEMTDGRPDPAAE